MSLNVEVLFQIVAEYSFNRCRPCAFLVVEFEVPTFATVFSVNLDVPLKGDFESSVLLSLMERTFLKVTNNIWFKLEKRNICVGNRMHGAE
jgi:hypothetical protein